jgi:hypothetical protein
MMISSTASFVASSKYHYRWFARGRMSFDFGGLLKLTRGRGQHLFAPSHTDIRHILD